MMKEFIAKAPDVFGDIWDFYFELRGVKETHSREQDRTEGKQNKVFFELMAMIHTTNEKKLMHWALIKNISNVARGVRRTAELAFTFFGHSLSKSPATTRKGKN